MPIDVITFSLKRLAFMVIIILTIIYLSHLGLDLARGVSWAAAGYTAGLKTVNYLSLLLHGNLGLTAAGTIAGLPTPVAEVVPELFKKSLGLLIVSLSFATLVGLILGIFAARRPQWSLSLIIVSIIGASLPSFLLAPLLQILMIQWTRIMGSPLLPLGSFGWDKRLILPALVLAARPIAQITRVTFLTFSNLNKQDFTRVAISKGLHDYVVLLKHVLPNAAIPILTTVAISLRFSLSSLAVVEYFFGWPGVGFSLLKAIARQDDNLTVALILLLALLFMLINLALELLYPLIDPRLREQQRATVVTEGLFSQLKSGLIDLIETFKQIVIRKQPHDDKRAKSRSLALSSSRNIAQEKQLQQTRRRLLIRQTLGNLPLMVGLVMVIGLLIIIFSGPALSPHSPFTTQGLTVTKGQLSVPPFAPSDIYPWGTDILGRDMLTLVLSGARQTFLLASMVVLARLSVGFLLGILAGWWAGSWLDRFLLSLAEMIAAFPTLLLTMILILALGIRQGLQPFILAFCFVGWGEIMQWVRAETLTIRPKLFIESARAVGLNTPRLIFGHVLPNLIPALISLAALEMGAVLVLLGELGFIGIFIGGGTLAETSRGLYHYSDVPEWGALLSNIRLYARSYTWLAIYPTLAFFMAILGFNLLGEGLRRLVDNVGFTITTWLNRYTVMIALLLLLGFNWLQANTGPIMVYRHHATSFSGEQAYQHLRQLSEPNLMGRALGTDGLNEAADNLAAQFEALGLQPAGKNRGYFYERKRSFEKLDRVPQLTLFDNGAPPMYQQDYNAFVSLFRNMGRSEGLVRVVATGPLAEQRGFAITYPALKGRSYEGEVLLLLSAQEATYLRTVPQAGLLVVTADPTLLQSNDTLLARDPINTNFGTNRQHKQDTPILWVNEAIANRLLAGTGQTVATLRLQQEQLIKEQIFELPTAHRVALSVEGTVVENQSVRQVLGYIPGSMGITNGRSLDSQMIIVMAQYDSPPLNPDGQPRLAANNYGSAVSVMLELIRTMQNSGYKPFKTILFVAYSGEGMMGGERVTPPEPSELLQINNSFGPDFKVEAVIVLRGLGAGDGAGLALSVSGSQRLANLFEVSAKQFSLPTTRIDEGVNLALLLENGRLQSGNEAPKISLQWQGSEQMARTHLDTLNQISVDKLEQAGRVISLALMMLGREKEY